MHKAPTVSTDTLTTVFSHSYPHTTLTRTAAISVGEEEVAIDKNRLELHAALTSLFKANIWFVKAVPFNSKQPWDKSSKPKPILEMLSVLEVDEHPELQLEKIATIAQAAYDERDADSYPLLQDVYAILAKLSKPSSSAFLTPEYIAALRSIMDEKKTIIAKEKMPDEKGNTIYIYKDEPHPKGLPLIHTALYDKKLEALCRILVDKISFNQYGAGLLPMQFMAEYAGVHILPELASIKPSIKEAGSAEKASPSELIKSTKAERAIVYKEDELDNTIKKLLSIGININTTTPKHHVSSKVSPLAHAGAGISTPRRKDATYIGYYKPIDHCPPAEDAISTPLSILIHSISDTMEFNANHRLLLAALSMNGAELTRPEDAQRILTAGVVRLYNHRYSDTDKKNALACIEIGIRLGAEIYGDLFEPHISDDLLKDFHGRGFRSVIDFVKLHRIYEALPGLAKDRRFNPLEFETHFLNLIKFHWHKMEEVEPFLQAGFPSCLAPTSLANLTYLFRKYLPAGLLPSDDQLEEIAVKATDESGFNVLDFKREIEKYHELHKTADVEKPSERHALCIFPGVVTSWGNGLLQSPSAHSSGPSVD
jgi:hypothetical protein